MYVCMYVVCHMYVTHLEEYISTIDVVVVAEIGSDELQLVEVVSTDDVFGFAMKSRQRHEILTTKTGRGGGGKRGGGIKVMSGFFSVI